eukprot:Nk52_evm4s2587 gene=Nk52_evmTU4s2587
MKKFSVKELANTFKEGKPLERATQVGEYGLDVYYKGGDIQETSKAVADMVDSVGTLTEAWIQSANSLDALSYTNGFVSEFIASFQDGSFKRHLEVSEQEEFAKQYEKYVAPFDLAQVQFANDRISSGLADMCDYLKKGIGPTTAKKVYTLCERFHASLDQILYEQTLMNEAGNNFRLTLNSIVEKYIVVSNLNSLSTDVTGILDNLKSHTAEADLMEVLALAGLNSVSGRFMGDSSLLCNLAEYYSNGNPSSSSECHKLRTSKDVMPVEKMASVLNQLKKDVEESSAFITSKNVCGKVPIFLSPQLNQTRGEYLNLQELIDKRTVSFQIPVDKKWLNRYGWSLISEGLDNGVNFLVKNIELNLPYPSFKGSKEVSLAFSPSSSYIVTSNGVLKEYIPGYSGLQYLYAYSLNDFYCEKPSPDLMEPCLEKDGASVLHDMCVEKDGSMSHHALFGNYPPEPSIFSPFQISLDNDNIELPLMANRRVDISDSKGDPRNSVLENQMEVALCFTLKEIRQTNSNGGHSNGVNGKCEPCAAGTYQTQTGECVKCPTGTFQDNQGWLTCKKCPVGFSQHKEGQSSCTKCDSEQSCPSPGMISPNK